LKAKQTLHPSLVIGEMFFPLTHDERNLPDVIRKAGEIGFYEGVETGMIFDGQVAKDMRNAC
jgi:hypothetical protein